MDSDSLFCCNYEFNITDSDKDGLFDISEDYSEDLHDSDCTKTHKINRYSNNDGRWSSTEFLSDPDTNNIKGHQF